MNQSAILIMNNGPNPVLIKMDICIKGSCLFFQAYFYTILKITNFAIVSFKPLALKKKA